MSSGIAAMHTPTSPLAPLAPNHSQLMGRAPDAALPLLGHPFHPPHQLLFHSLLSLPRSPSPA